MTRSTWRKSAAILALAFFFLAIDQARAGIGETEAQVQARYGLPVTVLQSRGGIAATTRCYASNGLVVAVTFLNGHSVREVISKADNSKLSDTDIEKQLTTTMAGLPADAQGITGPRNVTAGVQEWRSLDQRSRVAFYDSSSRALFITTQRFIDLTNATKRAVAIRADPGGMGARGRSDLNLRTLQKDTATALRSGSQPAATPAK
jgi:hypothetical protein